MRGFRTFLSAAYSVLGRCAVAQVRLARLAGLVTFFPQNGDTNAPDASTSLALWPLHTRPPIPDWAARPSVRARPTHDWAARHISQGTILSEMRPRRVDQGIPVRGLSTSRTEGIMDPYSLIVAVVIVPVVLDTLGLCASLIA